MESMMDKKENIILDDMSFVKAFLMGPGPKGKKEFYVYFLKGLLMGMADLIPGVSGGTVAFITGIYEKLIDAIASVNKDVLQNILKGNFKVALSLIHFRVLVPIIGGILISVFSFARLMNFCLTEYPVPTWSLFLGLILSSTLVISRHLGKIGPSTVLCMAFGFVFGFLIVSLIPVTTPENYGFIFLCGAIAITAMILPGISGSFILLILGKYEFITAAVKNPFLPENFITLTIFTLGTITGILGFTRFLKFILGRFHGLTMAFMTGLLLGTLKKLWPWKEAIETKIIHGKTYILTEANILPKEFNGEFYLSLFLIFLGIFVVLFLEGQSKDKAAS